MMKAPVMVVPGNHDIPAWYRPWTRVFNPIGRYRQYITAELQPTFQTDDLSVAGINTAHGLTIKGGRVLEEHAAFLRGFFHRSPPGAFKILALHHHLVKMERLGIHDVARSAKSVIDVIGEEEVDLVLCGHLHISSVQSFPVHEGRHHMVVASAGTATSSRGRGKDRRENLYNIVRIWPEHYVVEERGMAWEGGKFEFVREHPFTRD
jgi:3',5'-cyclic AMP phosphodiesterase CpdA